MKTQMLQMETELRRRGQREWVRGSLLRRLAMAWPP